MKDILAKANRATLSDFACSSVLLAFDFDGTLARIVSSPQRARMRLSTRHLLAQAARCYPCVVISGRRRDDVAKRLRGLPIFQTFGNHGLEPWSEDAASASLVREWVRDLDTALASEPGVVVEDKTYSVAIHYRHAANQFGVRRRITKAIRGLRAARALGGVKAINLIPRDAVDKGVVLQRARRLLACDTAIYVGDDDTDEVAFGSAPPDQLLAIRVGRAASSRARYRLRTQGDIDRLLRLLLALRASGPGARGGDRGRGGALPFESPDDRQDNHFEVKSIRRG
jgi:trehalose 6-phosphate phosphatase